MQDEIDDAFSCVADVTDFLAFLTLWCHGDVFQK